MQISKARFRYPEHFDGTHFYNPSASQARGLGDVLHWKLKNRPESSPAFIDDVQPAKPDASVPGLKVTMVNHATVLIQYNGLNILTDPIWSGRASPLSFIGPKRKRHPGIRFDELPAIDVILLSHNHYDHCDLTTLTKLRERFNPQIVTSLGLEAWLKLTGFAKVCELDWGDRVDLPQLTVDAVPAAHFSARAIADRNRTLWSGFVIDAPEGAIYFAGDTGFGPHFTQIARHYPNIRLALLPIGAYEPRWFMGPVHMAPQEAIDAHRILQPHTSIAIHHGTFQMADDAPDTAARVLREQLANAADSPNFIVLRNGESLIL